MKRKEKTCGILIDAEKRRIRNRRKRGKIDLTKKTITLKY